MWSMLAITDFILLVSLFAWIVNFFPNLLNSWVETTKKTNKTAGFKMKMGRWWAENLSPSTAGWLKNTSYTAQTDPCTPLPILWGITAHGPGQFWKWLYMHVNYKCILNGCSLLRSMFMCWIRYVFAESVSVHTFWVFLLHKQVQLCFCWL